MSESQRTSHPVHSQSVQAKRSLPLQLTPSIPSNASSFFLFFFLFLCRFGFIWRQIIACLTTRRTTEHPFPSAGAFWLFSLLLYKVLSKNPLCVRVSALLLCEQQRKNKMYLCRECLWGRSEDYPKSRWYGEA